MITLETILEEWAADSVVDRSKLDRESLKIGELHSKYLQTLTALKRRLGKLQRQLKDLEGRKTIWYSGKMTKEEMDRLGWPYDPWRGGNKPLKSDIYLWLETDVDMDELRDQLAETTIMHDTVMDIMNSINWRHQHIRNAISWLQFTTGS